MSFGTVKLNDGNEIPAIAFGTGSVWKGKDVTEYVEQAIESGYSHIDTAAIYQTEEGVALAIRESGLDRSDLYVTTKYDGGDVQAAVRESLYKLGLKQVDLYLIHGLFSAPDFVGVWKEFEKIKDSGLARSIGVSNFSADNLKSLAKVAKIVPAVNQIRLHPYNYSEVKDTVDYCTQHGIVIEAYNSLAPITSLPGGPVEAPINAAAKRLGATPTQVLLAWVKQKGAVIVTTSSKKEHLEEYLAVAKLGTLTDGEVAAIDEAGAKGPPTSLRVKIRQYWPAPFVALGLHALAHLARDQGFF